MLHGPRPPVAPPAAPTSSPTPDALVPAEMRHGAPPQASRARRRTLRQDLTTSLVVHLAVVGLSVALSYLHPQPAPPQNVLVTRLVRLGPPRPKEQLPQLESAAAAGRTRGARAKKDAPKRPSPEAEAAVAAAKVATEARAQEQAAAQSALARLKRQVAGAIDGDVAGDADVGQEGDRYAAELQRCLKDNFVFEGVDVGRLRGLRALVVLRIQADGRIIGHRIAESPGVPAFERAIARAVRGCDKVSAPPQAWQRQLRQEGIAIDFTP